ncbi:MAG: ABC transporter ATP-binding protein [Blautia sp.]|nr:ABC transporter ATP-binding protein [Blautia sp.]MDY5030695.1 ABC transporter ATP-binding protein [Blautia sp.]
MLKVDKISTYYGKVQALHEVSLEIGSGEMISIIGSNGAGKSTLMKSIMGIVQPKSGTITYDGKDITKMKASKVVYNGISYVPEGRAIFPEMTVRDNLEMGAFSRKYSGDEMEQHIEDMYQIFPRLKERQKQLAGSLSGGEQQMLAVCRGLMSDPRLIMFDEPSLGLAPVIVEEMFKVILEIHQARNIPVILVEQNAFMALKISDRCYVLENGVITLSGKSEELLESDEIRKSYLGG